MLHAAATIKQSDAEMRKCSGDSGEFVANNFFELGTAVGSEHMYKQLALGNLTLFLDIYPLHRFYMLSHGKMRDLRRCLPDRRAIENMVEWRVKNTLAFGLPFDEILLGFEALEKNDIATSVERLAQHEQVNILQKIIYDNPVTQAALKANQFAWVTKLPNGKYAEIQLTMSNQCSAKPAFTSWFSKELSAQLWDKDQRMEFVIRTARQFHKLLQGKERAAIENSIRSIYYGGGVQ